MKTQLRLGRPQKKKFEPNDYDPLTLRITHHEKMLFKKMAAKEKCTCAYLFSVWLSEK